MTPRARECARPPARAAAPRGARERTRGGGWPACRFAVLVTALLTLALPVLVGAQQARTPAGIDRDNVVEVTPSRRYEAGAVHRFLLGENYRKLWATPIRVPVLELGRYAGGVRATKVGGGKQTRSLRLENAVGQEFVFRPVYKDRLVLPDEYRGTIIHDIFNDAMSASHPTAVVVAAPLLKAAGVLHPTPALVIMGDTPRLGEFREEFAGRLGTVEEYPNVPDDAPGFAGAIEILDTDDFLERLNADPSVRVADRELLRARLLDFLLGDNDRHPDQWEWALMSREPGAPWRPVARDRDKVFVSHGGILPRLARLAAPYLVTFDHHYPDLVGFTGRVMEFDRRLLQGLDHATWDSVARALERTITDSVIDAGLERLPPEFSDHTRELRGKLRARRDRLTELADRYYRLLFTWADLHGTDAAEIATIDRLSDGSVEVTVAGHGQPPTLQRRFDPAVTREIRLYLHGGEDSVIVRGQAPHSILVRVIGGEGTNVLLDSSVVDGRRAPTRRYQIGTVARVEYGPDTLFDRRPWRVVGRDTVPPVRDQGSRVVPLIGFDIEHGLGLVPRVGATRYSYGFGQLPYASKASVDFAVSTELAGVELGLATDNRFEHSPWFLRTETRVSQLRVGEFHGFGNTVRELPRHVAEVRQTEWRFHPAFGFTTGVTTTVSAGPIMKYVSTGESPARTIAALHPYGFPRFGQVGMRFDLRHDSRARPRQAGADLIEDFKPKGDRAGGVAAAVEGAWYPAVWDARTAFGHIDAVAKGYLPLPIRPGAEFALRVGGKRVYGDFPYYEAAFLGGSQSLRTATRQRYAGDASLYGTAEVRVPIGDYAVVLPLNVGVHAFAEAGRVYMDGRSPGGWHTGLGTGVWVGFLDPSASLTLTLTNRRERRLLLGTGFAF